jgi:hypothetical protein
MTREGFARRLWRALRARDLIEFIRALSPRFDERVQKKVDEAAAKRSWSYHLFWWRMDRVPYRLRSMLIKNVERGLEDLGVFTAEFQQRHEVLRRYFAGDSLGKEERDAAAQMIKRFKVAASRLAVLDVLIDRKPGAGFISALNEVLKSEGAPAIPEKASAEDIARHLASIDPGLALKALRHAEERLKNEITMIIEEAKHVR